MALTTKLLAQETGYSITGPGIPVTDNPTTQMETIISGFIGFLSVIAVIFFVIQIILAGYSFISAQGDEKKIEIARKKVTEGILGLTIVVVAFGAGAFISSLLGLKDIFDLGIVVDSLKFK